MFIGSCVLLGLILLWIAFFSRSWDKVINFCMTAFVGLMLIGILLFVGMLAATQDIPAADEPYALQAISTGTGTSGEFFLGSGGFGSDAKFYWYEKNGESYTLEEAYADDVTIIERDGDPTVVYHTFDRETRDWIVYPFHHSSHYYDTLTFYVPPGSVASNIDLSLPKE
jgi:hypothetical protein